MKITLITVFIATIFGRFAQPANAQPKGSPPFSGGQPSSFISSFPLTAALDSDGDGVISTKEIEAATISLKKADKDRNGKLQADELMPRVDRRSRSKGRSNRRTQPVRRNNERETRLERIPPEKLSFEDGVSNIPELSTFEKLSYQGPEVMVDTHLANWKFVKFQIEDVAKGKPVIYFINTKTHRGHPFFMRKIGINRGDGSMRGVLVYRPLKKSPNGEPGMFTFEYEPNDAYPFNRIELSYKMLTKNMPYLKNRLGYYPMPSRALPLYNREKELYDEADFPVVLDKDLENDIGFLPLNTAESFGRLRLMKTGEIPSSRDVVLYNTLPNEMPRVAGVITAVRQTPLSHVNLRAIQDGIPNAFVTEATKNKNITELEGKLVYYKVDRNGYELRKATKTEVDEHFAAFRPAKVQSPNRDLQVKKIQPLSKIDFEDSSSFGVKASNLATLHTIELPENTVPNGFAIPFFFYDKFMKHNSLYEKARSILSNKAFKKSRVTQIEQLKKLRKNIKEARMPDWMMNSIGKLQTAFPKGQGIRCRSSTNNEDLPGFSGAGLYDSFTHKPDEGHLTKSIKQVFSSLWNFRAFEEREFYRIDHFTTAMGVLVHPNFPDEVANGVAVTDDILYQTNGNYYLNTQVGEDLITNPNAESVPEELLLDWWKPNKHKVMRRSSLAKGDTLLLSAKHMTQMNECLGKIHSHFSKLYRKTIDDKKFAMEIEYKITSNNKLAIKQARPWVY